MTPTRAAVASLVATHWRRHIVARISLFTAALIAAAAVFEARTRPPGSLLTALVLDSWWWAAIPMAGVVAAANRASPSVIALSRWAGATESGFRGAWFRAAAGAVALRAAAPVAIGGAMVVVAEPAAIGAWLTCVVIAGAVASLASALAVGCATLSSRGAWLFLGIVVGPWLLERAAVVEVSLPGLLRAALAFVVAS